MSEACLHEHLLLWACLINWPNFSDPVTQGVITKQFNKIFQTPKLYTRVSSSNYHSMTMSADYLNIRVLYTIQNYLLYEVTHHQKLITVHHLLMPRGIPHVDWSAFIS